MLISAPSMLVVRQAWDVSAPARPGQVSEGEAAGLPVPDPSPIAPPEAQLQHGVGPAVGRHRPC